MEIDKLKETKEYIDSLIEEILNVTPDNYEKILLLVKSIDEKIYDYIKDYSFVVQIKRNTFCLKEECDIIITEASELLEVSKEVFNITIYSDNICNFRQILLKKEEESKRKEYEDLSVAKLTVYEQEFEIDSYITWYQSNIKLIQGEQQLDEFITQQDEYITINVTKEEDLKKLAFSLSEILIAHPAIIFQGVDIK